MSGGVVERASKEISRRISSLGFKSGASKRTKSVDDPNRESHEERSRQDKLNGNEEDSSGSKSSMGSKMGTFVKGSVMDKVSHVFNNKEVSNIIPKGAVANGRARFEGDTKPEKGSKPKFGSPMLPVKSKQNNSAKASNNKNTNTTNNTSSVTTSATSANVSSAGSNNTAAAGARLELRKEYVGWSQLWQDLRFLQYFASLVPVSEWPVLAQINSSFRQALYSLPDWNFHFRPVLRFKELHDESNESNMFDLKLDLMKSFVLRNMDQWVLWQANDLDIFDFVQKFNFVADHVRSLELRNCNIADRSLEAITEFLSGVTELKLVGCNEITEQGLWSSLNARLTHLAIHDCINVADECICAVTQLLPNLQSFNLQAYHVTDSALAYFSPKQSPTLVSLSLHSCWEITNHGVVNIVHTLPNLTELSLSGCSKLSDDGVELIAENLRKLRKLDLSWCPRVTDHALEYIACDLHKLEELNLDRCVHVTDIGIGYISTLMALNTLFLRWCSQLKDYGLQHICNMHNLRVLSLAGCPLLTSGELTHLVQLRHLRELELTNCPGATAELVEYLRQGLPEAIVID